MIRFKYQPTLENYVQLNRYAFAKIGRFITPIIIIITLLSFLQPFALWMLGHEKSLPKAIGTSAPLFILPIVYFFARVSYRRAIQKRWESAEELRVEREFEFTDSGIDINAASFRTHFDWKHIKVADLWNGFVFIKTGQNQFVFFPESIVPDRKAFFELLQGQIPLSEAWKKKWN